MTKHSTKVGLLVQSRTFTAEKDEEKGEFICENIVH